MYDTVSKLETLCHNARFNNDGASTLLAELTRGSAARHMILFPPVASHNTRQMAMTVILACVYAQCTFTPFKAELVKILS